MGKEEKMKTLWEEKFNPQPVPMVEPTETEFDKAWSWIFEKDNSGEFVRAGLCLILIREKSLKMRRADMIKKSAEMAAVGIWKRYSGQRQLPVRKINS